MSRGHSWATSDRARNVMQGNRSRDTRPELAVRRLLFAAGLRYRVNVRPVVGLRRTADIVFPKARVAVFVDGCFWHGCPLHYVPSKSNRDYWNPKIEANSARDAETTSRLEDLGWRVLRFWAHDPPGDVAAQIVEVVRASNTTTNRPAEAAPES
ncbi:very short patch repair endonuclease [Mycobacterium sp. E787]|uniref:very short patch repair endonuclease n=1 Tax=Mycobacterium sp. E787 TaxID=1834150 RepID=UPI0009EE3D1D|nr:very short patch repair endonuclease [Mycobacterium sp. E787]